MSVGIKPTLQDLISEATDDAAKYLSDAADKIVEIDSAAYDAQIELDGRQETIELAQATLKELNSAFNDLIPYIPTDFGTQDQLSTVVEKLDLLGRDLEG